MLLLFSQWLSAKVAYLPLIEPGDFYPKRTALMAMDLHSGQMLDRVEIGAGVGPVFVNNTGKQLFAAAESDRKIVRIDTESIDIIEQWNNLPDSPEKIFLSEDNNKLYFLRLNPGSGGNDLYQIDLTNNQISSVINFSSSGISEVTYSENLKYITLLVNNHSTNQFSVHTYNSNDLTLKSSSNLPSYMPIKFIDNEGDNFYYGDYNESQFISRKLSDASINWSYSYSGESAYFSPYEKDTSILIVNGSINSYEIDKQTGVGNALTIDGTNISFFGNYDRVHSESFVVVEYPSVICITGMCSLGSKLNINKVNLVNNTQELVYQSQNLLGSAPIGRFVGENFYRGMAVQQVSVLNHFGLILLMFGFVAVMSFRVIKTNR